MSELEIDSPHLQVIVNDTLTWTSGSWNVAWKVAVVIASSYWHLTLFTVFSKPSQRYPNSDIQVQRANYQVSLCHSIITALLALYLEATEFIHLDLFDFFNHPSSFKFNFISCFLLGYTIYDLHVVTFYKKTRSFLYVCHHLATIVGVSMGIAGHFPALITLFYVGYLPVVFVNVQMLADFAGWTMAVSVLKPVSFLAWMIFRLGVIPYVLQKTFSYHKLYPNPDPVKFGVLFFLFCCFSLMNIHWAKKLLTGSFSTNKKRLKTS